MRVYRFRVTFVVKGGNQQIRDGVEVRLVPHKSARITFKAACFLAKAPFEAAGHKVIELKQLV